MTNEYANQNPFEGCGESKIFENGTYIEPGKYRLKVIKCILKDTLNSGKAFIAEFEVVETVNGDHTPGDTVTWFQKMSYRAVALSSIKTFAAAVMGVRYNDTESLSRLSASLDQVMLAAVSDKPVGKFPAHILDGREVLCEAYSATSKKGIEITRHNWSPAT